MSKRVTQSTRLNAHHDRNTLRHFRALGIRTRFGPGSRAVLHKGVSSLDPRESEKNPATTGTIKGGKKRTRKNFTPAPWNRATALIKMTYAILVLRENDNDAIPITVQLGEKRLEQAKRTGKTPLDHVRREIDRKLKKALGRPVDFVLCMESVCVKGHEVAPHLHGVLGIAPHERKIAKRVLRDVAGDFDPSRAVKFSKWKSPFGWADYATKQLRDKLTRDWPQGFTMTAELLRRARAMYEEDRARFLATSTSKESVRLASAA